MMLNVTLLPPKKQKPPKPESDKKTEGFYGPKALWTRLTKIAAAEGRNRSELVVGILEQWVADYEKSKSRKAE